MTDKDGNLLWYGEYTAWGRLKEESKVTDSVYQPFRLQIPGFIGSCVDKDTGDETPTEWGIIHSSKKGVHIVPALPDIT